MGKDIKKIAVCYCGEPLVYTFMFSGAEYFCMGCGSHFGMFDTERTEATPALKAKLKRREAKWHKISDGLLTGGVMFKNCDKCGEESHLQHATPKEIKAHELSLKQLEKIGKS